MIHFTTASSSTREMKADKRVLIIRLCVKHWTHHRHTIIWQLIDSISYLAFNAQSTTTVIPGRNKIHQNHKENCSFIVNDTFHYYVYLSKLKLNLNRDGNKIGRQESCQQEEHAKLYTGPAPGSKRQNI